MRVGYIIYPNLQRRNAMGSSKMDAIQCFDNTNIDWGTNMYGELHRVLRVATLTALVTLPVCAPSMVSAREIFIDFQNSGNPATDQYGSSGLFMSFACPAGGAGSAAAGSCDITGLQNNGSLQIQLGFDVRIGGTDYTSLFVNENGFVTFGTAPPAISGPLPTTLAGLQTALGSTPFIAASYANLAPGNGGIGSVLGSGGGMMFQRGLGLPGGRPAGTVLGTDPAGRAALDIVWSDPNLLSGSHFRSELILYSLDPLGQNGEFAFRLNYENTDSLGHAQSYGVLAAYSLGSLSGSFAEPFNPNTDYFVRSVATTAAPEPGSLLLAAAGLLTAMTLRRRRSIRVPAGR